MTSQTGAMGNSESERMKQGATGVQERVMSGADTGMDKAAEGLSSAADKMRNRDDGGVRSQIETKAADVMDRTADYLKEHDSSELMHDIEEFVKAHPIQAAAGALAAGYVLGKLVR